ncbi:GxxExxY protein [Lacipirellula limnantheis]|uniref:GxxExxY protein n=1 Tax=Lacipirellula limnantheis TaxID=2528024 RepID=UPI0011A663AD|nr:GxxExxY protein [Lacipirellula limnantheis]
MSDFDAISESTELAAKSIVDSCYKVHSALGPGLLESVYESCLVQELTRRGLKCQRQVPVDIEYEGLRIDGGLRIDLLVEDAVVVELKAVDEMIPVFEAQLLTYLKLAKKRLGFLVNFNSPLMKQGLRRMVR